MEKKEMLKTNTNLIHLGYNIQEGESFEFINCNNDSNEFLFSLSN